MNTGLVPCKDARGPKLGDGVRGSSGMVDAARRELGDEFSSCAPRPPPLTCVSTYSMENSVCSKADFGTAPSASRLE